MNNQVYNKETYARKTPVPMCHRCITRLSNIYFVEQRLKPSHIYLCSGGNNTLYMNYCFMCDGGQLFYNINTYILAEKGG